MSGTHLRFSGTNRKGCVIARRPAGQQDLLNLGCVHDA
jgi:hypothetical protein